MSNLKCSGVVVLVLLGGGDSRLNLKCDVGDVVVIVVVTAVVNGSDGGL